MQKMVSSQVVQNITCRNSIYSQNVQRARRRSGPEVVISPLKTRRLSCKSSTALYKPVATPVCFFCNQMGNKQELRKTSTFGLDKRVRDCAYLIGGKHSLGDMVGIDAIYHCACLTGFYRKMGGKCWM